MSDSTLPPAESASWFADWAYPLGRCALYAGGAYAALVALLVLFEERLVFPGPKYPSHGQWEGHGLPVEDVWFTSADGTKLHGWYLPHSGAHAAVLYCHGNAGTVAEQPQFLRFLHDECQSSVFIFDYRGYGRSEGSPNETGILADARAARAWLAEREKIAEEQVVIYGRSLGGAIAVDLAAEKPARGLILESTFTCLPDVAAGRFWFVPVRQLMRSQLNSLAKISRYEGPLLQYHSRDDEVIPFALGEQLFAAAGSKTKEFYTAQDRGHNGSPPPEYCAKVSEFLTRLK